MADGLVATLDELIALRRYAQSPRYHQIKTIIKPSGTHLSKLRGRGMEFAEVRNYQAGDEIRHMEWRVTARTGRPHVKIYQEERERPVVILCDFNPSMFFGTRIAFKSVLAARLTAMLAWTALKEGDRVGGLFFSATEHHEFTPRGRDKAIVPMLASLSDYSKKADQQAQSQARILSDALTRLHRVARPGSLLILISDFYSMDSECEQHLSRLVAHNDVLSYHICDPIELFAPKPQQYPITNGEQEIVFDTQLSSVRTAYTHYCQQRIAQLKKRLHALTIQYVQVTPELDLPQLVRQTFPGRSHG